MVDEFLDDDKYKKKITIKERSSATGPSLSGGTNLRTKFTGGSVTA